MAGRGDRGAVTHMRDGDPGRVAGLTDSPEHCTDIAAVTVPATPLESLGGNPMLRWRRTC